MYDLRDVFHSQPYSLDFGNLTEVNKNKAIEQLPNVPIHTISIYIWARLWYQWRAHVTTKTLYKIHCESFCVKKNCPLYLCKQHHQIYRKLLKLPNNVLSRHWFLLNYLLEPWLNYRCDDLTKEQVQKHLLIHTDHWLPLLFNFSHTLKCSFRLGLHHGINNTWTHKTSFVTKLHIAVVVLSFLVVERLCSLFKSLAMQVFYQGLFVHVAWKISKVIIRSN